MHQKLLPDKLTFSLNAKIARKRTIEGKDQHLQWSTSLKWNAQSRPFYTKHVQVKTRLPQNPRSLGLRWYHKLVSGLRHVLNSLWNRGSWRPASCSRNNTSFIHFCSSQARFLDLRSSRSQPRLLQEVLRRSREEISALFVVFFCTQAPYIPRRHHVLIINYIKTVILITCVPFTFRVTNYVVGISNQHYWLHKHRMQLLPFNIYR